LACRQRGSAGRGRHAQACEAATHAMGVLPRRTDTSCRSSRRACRGLARRPGRATAVRATSQPVV